MLFDHVQPCIAYRGWRRRRTSGIFKRYTGRQRAFQLLPSVRDVFEERLRIEDGNKYLCSIGSCGQPRDYDPRACYGIWDDVEKMVEFRRVPYDADKTARKIVEAGLSHHFARRLLHGV